MERRITMWRDPLSGSNKPNCDSTGNLFQKSLKKGAVDRSGLMGASAASPTLFSFTSCSNLHYAAVNSTGDTVISRVKMRRHISALLAELPSQNRLNQRDSTKNFFGFVSGNQLPALTTLHKRTFAFATLRPSATFPLHRHSLPSLA